MLEIVNVLVGSRFVGFLRLEFGIMVDGMMVEVGRRGVDGND